ncbi:MAG: DUF3301 domain-containing protein [Gallionella sp.]
MVPVGADQPGENIAAIEQKGDRIAAAKDEFTAGAWAQSAKREGDHNSCCRSTLRKEIEVDFASLSVLLVSVALVWFWLHSMRIIEIAREAGRQVCKGQGVQFLDDTVASIKLELVRDANGRRTIRRTYRFEFSETGNNRREGRVVMHGSNVESVTMEPYQILQ